MAASDYVPIFFKNRLHLAGRPQMSTRPGVFRSKVLVPLHKERIIELDSDRGLARISPIAARIVEEKLAEQ